MPPVSDWPKTRAAAKAAGTKFYFTGKPCKRGHMVLRYTSVGSCSECVSEHGRRWAEQNPTATRERSQRWAEQNPTALRERGRRWAAQNPTATRAKNRRANIKARGFQAPPWQTAEEREAVEAYCHACPLDMTVDHIVPLRHPEVVGLHVLQNLAYLTDADNKRKLVKLPDGLTPAQAVERGMAIWRRDVAEDGTINWEPYRPR